MKKQNKGFTLTELIIVIVIIGILAAVLIPSLSSYVKKAKQSAAEQNALTAYKELLVDIDDEDYGDASVLNYIVASDDYYVLIVKGSVTDSFLKNDNSKYTVATLITYKESTLDSSDLTTSLTTTETNFVLINDGNKLSDVFGTKVSGTSKYSDIQIRTVKLTK